MLAIFLYPAPDLAFCAIAILPLALTTLTKINVFSLLRSVLPLIMMFLIIAAFTFFGGEAMSKGGDLLLDAPFLYICTGDVIYFLHRSAILIGLLVAGALLLATTSPFELTEGLASIFSPLQKLGVPVSQLSIILALAIRFIPVIGSLAKNISTAQILRGAKLDHGGAGARIKAATALILPITVATLRFSDQLSLSLLSKNYIPGMPRTKWDLNGFKKRQKNS